MNDEQLLRKGYPLFFIATSKYYFQNQKFSPVVSAPQEKKPAHCIEKLFMIIKIEKLATSRCMTSTQTTLIYPTIPMRTIYYEFPQKLMAFHLIVRPSLLCKL